VLAETDLLVTVSWRIAGEGRAFCANDLAAGLAVVLASEELAEVLLADVAIMGLLLVFQLGLLLYVQVGGGGSLFLNVCLVESRVVGLKKIVIGVRYIF